MLLDSLGLYLDNYKAIYRNVQLPMPTYDSEKERFVGEVVISESQLEEWERIDGEIVKVEDLSGGGTLWRVTHTDGSVSIEPPYRLFPLGKIGHEMPRNSLLLYDDVETEVRNTAAMNDELRENPSLTERCCHCKPFFSFQLKCMLCRKLDINLTQANMRTADYDANKWLEVLENKFDQDLMWTRHI